MPAKHAALYTRVSSDLQDVDLSLGAQETELRARAARDGYDVIEIFADPAESGRLSDRPGFQRMLSAAKRTPPPFQRLYLWDIRRFGRNRIDSAVFKQLLRSRGIEIVYLKEQLEDTVTGRMIEAVLEAMAEYESANIAEEVRRGQREITRRGFRHGGRAPYGYRAVRVPDGDRERMGLEPDPENAETVRWIFRERLSGISPGAITRDLNARGVPAPKGGRWKRVTVAWILSSPVYCGRYVYGTRRQTIRDGKVRNIMADPEKRVVREEAVEPLVSVGDWEKIQAMRQQDRRGGNHQVARRTYLLTGLAWCPCGGPLVGHQRTRRNGDQLRFYRCRTAKHGGDCDRGGTVNAEILEGAVLDTLRRRLETIPVEDLIDRYSQGIAPEQEERRRRVEQLRKEAATVEKGLARLLDALQAGLPREPIQKRMEELQGRKRRIEETASEEEASAALDAEAGAQFLRETFRSLGEQLADVETDEDREDLREILQGLFRIRFDMRSRSGWIDVLMPGEAPLPFAVGPPPGDGGVSTPVRHGVLDLRHPRAWMRFRFQLPRRRSA